jgi:hypothetical protein
VGEDRKFSLQNTSFATGTMPTGKRSDEVRSFSDLNELGAAGNRQQRCAALLR